MIMESYCLKWTHFQSSLISNFISLQNTEDLADVTLTSEGRSIKAHKVILSACSPYFRNIFKENPCPHPIVILKDVAFCDLLAILSFMYHGEVFLAEDKLSTFMNTANILNVSGLVTNPDSQNSSSPHSTLSQNPSLQNISVAPVHHQDNETQTKKAKKKRKSQSNKESKAKLLNNIKGEVENFTGTESINVSDRFNTYEQHSSSEALNHTDDHEFQPSSILERSLTLQAPTQISEDDTSKNGRKSKDKAVADLSKINDLTRNILKYEEGSDNETNESNNSYLDTFQPHHSSQSGVCPHCGTTYSNQSSLKYHVRLLHSDLTNMYCCHLCPESFDFRETYKQHMIEMHCIRN